MTYISSRDTLGILATAIPGFLTMRAIDPWSGLEDSLPDIIVRLNDSARWSREDIATWLEGLDLDLEIKPFDEISPLAGCQCHMCQQGFEVLTGTFESMYVGQPEPLKPPSTVLYVSPIKWEITADSLDIVDYDAWKKTIYEQFKMEEPNQKGNKK